VLSGSENMTSFSVGHLSALTFQHLDKGITKHNSPFITPCAVIHISNKARLFHFPPQQRHFDIPIVLVYALIKRSFVPDLLPGGSVVERLGRAKVV
jgi:poly(3-hydroxyalkanoate) synthetase